MTGGLYDALLLLHVLLFVYWLGADLAVFYSAGYAADSALPIETRVVIAEIMGFVDLFPRMSVPLIGAVGASLATSTGRISLDGEGLAIVWIVALVWVATNLHMYRHRRSPQRIGRWRRFDFVWRATAASLVALAGAMALAGMGVTDDRAVALKLIIFAAAVFLSLVLRTLFSPFRPALARLAGGHGQPDDSAIMQQALSRARPVVLAIWAMTIAAAAIGLWEPV